MKNLKYPHTQRAAYLPHILGLLGILGGFVNGLLGTGGGILLLYALQLAGKANEKKSAPSKDNFAAVLLCTLPLSLLSVLLYFHNHGLHALDVSACAPYLLGAVFGGALGAILLDKLKLQTVRILFALLLLFAGWRMAFS